MHRRDVITAAAATAGAGLATPASAEEHWPWQATGTETPDHLTDGKPEHVDLSFPRSAIEAYQPKLVTRHLTVQPTKQYAWLATSPEYDYDVYCYWTFYPRQEGLTSRDSHWLDREPCYVFVDKTTGDVETVVYAAYHWYSNRTLPALADGTHPTFRAADRWHHYIQTTTEGRVLELEDFETVFEDWLRNGWDEDLAVGAAQNPALMLGRETWFRRDAGAIAGVNADALLASTYLTLGIRGADKSDLKQ